MNSGNNSYSLRPGLITFVLQVAAHILDWKFDVQISLWIGCAEEKTDPTAQFFFKEIELILSYGIWHVNYLFIFSFSHTHIYPNIIA